MAKQTTLKIQTVSINWGWFVFLGILLFILGIIGFINLGVSTFITTYYIGIIMMIGGFFQLFHSIRTRNWKYFVFWLISGLLYTMAGLFCFLDPVLAASILTFFLAFALIFAGLFRLFISWNSKNIMGWTWLLLSALITILAGFFILFGWPANTIWVLGLFLAVDLLLQGVSWFLFGLGLKQNTN